MGHWTELRTALMVARTGTIMNAAASLNAESKVVTRLTFQVEMSGLQVTKLG